MDFSDVTNKPALLKDGFVAAALEAGRVIMDVYADGTAVIHKSDGSPVTAADERAEAIIARHLLSLDPAIPVVAEEAAAAGRIPAIGETFILVDPLDGTREFMSRNGEFTVNIAFIRYGVPVLGVVYAPALGLIYIGGEDVPAACGTVREGVVQSWAALAVRPPPAALTVIGSRSHGGAETEAFIAGLPVAEFVAAGSSLKFCRLAEGAADLYPRLGRTMEWDIAAGDAVLRAAGGAVLAMDGTMLAYGKRNQADDSDFANPHFVATGGFNPFNRGQNTHAS